MSAAILAQQPVFRCGQEYTNAPANPSQCERLSGQAVTVIPGVRVQAREASEPAPVRGADVPALRADAVDQKQRDELARVLVRTELDKARQRHAQLQQRYLKPEPSLDGASRLQLKAALERAQRDIDSLQRELDRRPTGHAAP